MSNNRTKFIQSISVQSVITITMGIMELMVFSLMSRILTKEDFGYFAALSGIITICTSITEAGLGAAIIQKKNATSSFISTAFTLSLLLGVIGASILFIFAPIIADIIADRHLIIPLRIMSINVFLACLVSVGKSILIRDLKFKRYGSYEVVAYFTSSIMGIILAFLGFGLYAIVAISVCNLILLNVILYTRQIKFPQFKIAKNEVRGIVSFGGWLSLSVVVNNITQQMDRLFLSKWLSVTALGSYNRPAGFVSTITGKINGIFDMVLFPMLSKLQDDSQRIQNIYIQALKLLNSFSAVLFAVFFFNAELIILIFFGDKWLELIPILQIISIFIIFNIDNRLVDCFFRSLGYVDTGFYLRLISAIVTFGSLYIGAKHNIYGVAISLVAANIFTVFMKIIILSHKVKVDLSVVVMSFITAQKPLIPLSLIGIPFLIFTRHTFFDDIIFAAAMASLIFVLFVFFPAAISAEYKRSLYPTVKGFLNKIKKNKPCV